MAFLNTTTATFYDDKGEYLGKKNFSKKAKNFEYGTSKNKGLYNVILNASFRETSIFPLLWKRRTYFYNISNSNPLVLNKKAEPLLSPEMYFIQIKTEIAKKLNDLAKTGFLEYLTPRNIIIGIVVLVLLYFIASGKKLW